MTKGVIIGGVTLSFFATILVVQATDYSSTNFTIRDPVINIGGNRATSTGFDIYSSLGQAAIGQSTSTDFILRSGFLYYPAPEASGSAGRGHAVQLYYSPATITTGRLISKTQGINFSGKAYPNAKITLLKDAQLTTTAIAKADASFSISLTEIAAGNYIFGLHAKDNRENTSLLQTYPITILPEQDVTVSGVFIAPTLFLDKSEVKKADILRISGQSAPNAIITIIVGSQQELITVQADGGGNYSYDLDTTPLNLGKHLVKAQSSIGKESTPFSKLIAFIVGTKNIAVSRVDGLATKPDINEDGRVNLVDLSIAIHWYGRYIREGIEPPAAVDLNNDKKVDLTDFSILVFYWTG